MELVESLLYLIVVAYIDAGDCIPTLLTIRKTSKLDQLLINYSIPDLVQKVNCPKDAFLLIIYCFGKRRRLVYIDKKTTIRKQFCLLR